MKQPLVIDLSSSTSPVRLLLPVRHTDARGWLTETYSEHQLGVAGIDCRFVQENHSLSLSAFTLRGLHYQAMPYAQAKLVRCIRGRIFSVAVDIRESSTHRGRWIGAELSAETGAQLFLPTGFAHGFLTLEPNCEVTYKLSERYMPDAERRIRWDDPRIGIEWPLPPGVVPKLSNEDLSAAPFDDCEALPSDPL